MNTHAIKGADIGIFGHKVGEIRKPEGDFDHG